MAQSHPRIILSFAVGLALLAEPAALAASQQAANSETPNVQLEPFRNIPGQWIVTPYQQTAEGIAEGPAGSAEIEALFGGLGYRNTVSLPFGNTVLEMTDILSFDAVQDVYRYVVLDNDSGLLDTYRGGFEGDVFSVDNLHTDLTYRTSDGTSLKFKLVWSDLERDSFTIDLFASQDAGVSWFHYFGQNYVRVAQAPDCSPCPD